MFCNSRSCFVVVDFTPQAEHNPKISCRLTKWNDPRQGATFVSFYGASLGKRAVEVSKKGSSWTDPGLTDTETGTRSATFFLFSTFLSPLQEKVWLMRSSPGDDVRQRCDRIDGPAKVS